LEGEQVGRTGLEKLPLIGLLLLYLAAIDLMRSEQFRGTVFLWANSAAMRWKPVAPGTLEDWGV